MEKWAIPPIHDKKKILETFPFNRYRPDGYYKSAGDRFGVPGQAQVQATIVGDKGASASGADTSLITASGSGIGLIEQAVLNKGASASEKLKHMFLSKFPGFVGFKSVKDLYSKTIVRDKGASASEGDTSLITGSEIGLIDNRKPLVKEQNDNHTIDIPAQEDSPPGRFPYEERHKVGMIAVLCIAASAQTLLSLVGGSGAMRLPESVYYCTTAANAIAFGASSLALLLVNKKPHAASILEKVGFASAIATFILMMRAVIQ